MPIVEATHDPLIATAQLRSLAKALPHAVSLAVECPEEPYDGNLQPGDVEVRFRPRRPPRLRWAGHRRRGAFKVVRQSRRDASGEVRPAL